MESPTKTTVGRKRKLTPHPQVERRIKNARYLLAPAEHFFHGRANLPTGLGLISRIFLILTAPANRTATAIFSLARKEDEPVPDAFTEGYPLQRVCEDRKRNRG